MAATSARAVARRLSAGGDRLRGTASRRTQRLAVQFATAQILAQAESLDDRGEKFLRSACRRLGWRLGELWLVDTAAEQLHLAACWHAPGAALETFARKSRSLTVAPGRWLPGKIWADG